MTDSYIYTKINEEFHKCQVCVFVPVTFILPRWMDDFVRLLLGLTPCAERAWAHQQWQGQTCCSCWSCLSFLCDSSVLLCLCLRMAFPSAQGSSGARSVCWKTPAFVLSVKGRSALVSFRCVAKKTQVPLPPIGISQFGLHAQLRAVVIVWQDGLICHTWY